MDYNEMLRQALLGRRPDPSNMPVVHKRGPMFSFWGEELGFAGADVHASRAYRIYLTYGEDLMIRDVRTVIEGELISPCSGYYPETLDQFDYPVVRDWCLMHTVDTPDAFHKR